MIIAKDNTVYALVIRVTTHEARAYDQWDYTIQEWETAGLNAPSVVRIRKIAKLEPDRILDYIGRLDAVDILEIQNRMKQYQAEKNKRLREMQTL